MSLRNCLRTWLTAAACLACSGTLASAQVRISQLYGGGAVSANGFNADFIELYNAGASPVALAGKSVQIASGAASTAWTVVALTGSIPANGYYLVRLEAASATGRAYVADQVPGTLATSMSSSTGKGALVDSITPITGAGCTTPGVTILDLVTYGTTASATLCYEGTVGNALTTSGGAFSVLRKCAGAIDANDNRNDFQSNIATPRNSSVVAAPSGPRQNAVITPASGAPATAVLLTSTPILCSGTATSVTADLSQLGGSAAQPLFDDGTNGDVTAANGTFSFSFTVGAVGAGTKTIVVSATDSSGRTSTDRLLFDISGACCTSSAACALSAQSACTGVFTGAASCTPSPCTNAFGSCCVGTACSVTGQSACTGTWTAGASCGYAAPVIGATPIEDISASPSATQLTLGDDTSSAVISIPFTFRHFGVVKPSLIINSNGWLTFDTAGAPTTVQMRTPVVPMGFAGAGQPSVPNDFIAAYWRDLNQNAAQTPAQTVSYETRGTAPFRRFIALWKVAIFSNTGYNVFEIILNEGSDVVEIRYGAFTVAVTNATFGAGLENAAGTGGRDIASTSIAQNTSYIFVPADPCNPVSYPNGACCAGASCTTGTQAACFVVGGSYQGDTSTCSPSPCVTGACCALAGGCAVTIQTLCQSANGFYQGDTTTCGQTACPVAGVCCTGTSCAAVFQANCTGTFTAGGSCSPNLCAASCCTTTGTCSLVAAGGSCAGTLGAPGSTCSGASCLPVNDTCAGAIALALGSTFTGVNSQALDNDGAASTCQANVHRGVWFSFTAPAAGTYRFSTCGTTGGNTDTVLTVYTGSCGSLTLVGCNDDAGPSCTGLLASYEVTAAAPTTYLVRLESYNTSTGSYSILASQVVAIGICCSNSTGACTVLVSGTCATGTTLGTGTTCGTGTPSTSCAATAVCCNSTTFACSLIYGGSCAAGSTTGTGTSCSPTSCPATGACCTGTVCALVLDNSGSPTCAGTYRGVNTACASPNPCFPADECQTTNLVATVGANPVNSTGASTSTVLAPAGCPSGLAGSSGSNDIFIKFTPVHTGAYKLETCGTAGYDSVLSIHSGCPATDANLILCNDDFLTGATCVDASTPAGLRSVLNSVSLMAGQLYFIRVAGYGATGGPTGAITINIGNLNTTGSCCNGTVCSLTDSSNCTGTFAAAGVCSPNPCAPAGVCCRGSTCTTTITTDAACTSSLTGGTAGASFPSGAACNGAAVSNSPCCYGDYNKVGGVTVTDIFNFLSDWFAGSPFARTGGNGDATPLSVQNIFDFLSNWFAGCP